MAHEPSRVLESFLADVQAIRVFRSKASGPSLKKPVLLLALISILERGELLNNRVRFTDLEKEVGQANAKYPHLGTAKVEEAFVRLQTSPFWSFHAPSTYSQGSGGSVPARVLRHPDCYGELDLAVFDVLRQSQSARAKAAELILNKWWPPEEHGDVRACLTLPPVP